MICASRARVPGDGDEQSERELEKHHHSCVYGNAYEE